MPRPVKKRPPLTPAHIVEVALQLVDEDGLDRLTLRHLADRLGVQNPALYWHFESKQRLIDGMAHRLIERMVTSRAGDAAIAWDEWLARAATVFRATLLSCRDGARILAGADLSDQTLQAHVDGAIQRLIDAGFAETDAFAGVIAVFDYTLGATFEEQGEPAKHRPPPGWQPTLAMRIATAGRLDREAMFQRGVQLFISGLRQKLSGPLKRRRR
jgi:TetR/AcrR family tetracycline transcriptional repressor